MATKFYLHRGTANPPGTMPGATALGGTPTVSATGANTLRWMDGTISAVAQTSAVSTTDGTSNAQTAWHTRHISAPLAAQTISAQTITYSLAAAEANAGSNFNPTIYLTLWRPGTGTEVGALLAVGAITATEPSTTQTATSGTATSTQQIAQAGDVLIVETWRKSVAPGQTTARTNTTFYDGTTEASTTNVATFVNFANTLTFQAQVAAPTVLSMTWTGDTPTVTATDNQTAVPTSLAMTWTGATPIVVATSNVLCAPDALALTWTGATPTVNTPVVSQPTALATTLTFATPTVATPVSAQPTALGLTLTLATPEVKTPVTTAPDALSLTMSFGTPVITTPVASEPSGLSLALTFATPNVQAGTTIDTQVIPGALSLTLSLATPSVLTPVKALPTALGMTWTGAVPTVAKTDSVTVVPSVLRLRTTWARPLVVGSGGGGTPVVHHRVFKATFRPIHHHQAVPAAASFSLVFSAPLVVVVNPNAQTELELVLYGFI